MANLLPFEPACLQATSKAQTYYEAVQRYRKYPTKANRNQVMIAYSKLAAAQWELEQHEAKK